MPIMNGFEATAQLKQLIKAKVIPDIKILACTAYSTYKELEKCYESGMDEVTTKPINYDHLVKLFKKLKIL